MPTRLRRERSLSILMKIEISKGWCLRMAQHEGDAEIGAGRLAIDPVFDGEQVLPGVGGEESPNVAFGRFVNLMRRRRGMSLEAPGQV